MSFSSFNIKLLAFLILGMLWLLGGCKKPDDPQLTDNGPVFSVKGSVDGQPLQLTAKGEYYMFTDYVYNSADTLYSFNGKLQKAQCANCGEAIEISLYDAQTSTGQGPVDINQLLLKTQYDFQDPYAGTKKQYQLQFVAEDSGYVNPSYTWTLGGATANDSTIKNPIITFPDTITRNVCLTIVDKTTACTKTICNKIRPFEVDKGDSMVPNFYYINGKTTIFVNETKAQSFQWDFGDGIGKSIAYNPEYLYNKEGTYMVKMTSNIFGISRTLQKKVTVKDPFFDCQVNYSYKNPSLKVLDKNLKSKIVITYRDKNGQEYISNLKPQPTGSLFTLLGHSDYIRNDKGQKTESITFTFKCRVFSTTGSGYKDLDISSSTMAVAYP